MSLEAKNSVYADMFCCSLIVEFVQKKNYDIFRGFFFSHYHDPDIVVKLHELIGEIEFFSSKYLQTAILRH